jgi:hypothetical protein
MTPEHRAIVLAALRTSLDLGCDEPMADAFRVAIAWLEAPVVAACVCQARDENMRKMRALLDERCEHHKRCGDCHSPSIVDDLRAEVDRLRSLLPTQEERETLTLVVDTLLCAVNPEERRAIDTVRTYLARTKKDVTP